MKITREINGINVEIELTDNELWSAYAAQEHKFDIADVRSILTNGEDVEGKGPITWIRDDEDENSAVVLTDDDIDQIAYRLRKFYDWKDDGDWLYSSVFEAAHDIVEWNKEVRS